MLSQRGKKMQNSGIFGTSRGKIRSGLVLGSLFKHGAGLGFRVLGFRV